MLSEETTLQKIISHHLSVIKENHKQYWKLKTHISKLQLKAKYQITIKTQHFSTQPAKLNATMDQGSS